MKQTLTMEKVNPGNDHFSKIATILSEYNKSKRDPPRTGLANL